MMEKFSFSMQTQIECGPGLAAALPDCLAQHGTWRRVLLVSDPGVRDAGIVDPVKTALEHDGYEVTLFVQVRPNPHDEDCLAGAQLMRSFGGEAIVAIGGGSAMDTAKTIALLAACDGTPVEYADGIKEYGRPYPLFCLPTTAGTGSEVTRSAVITQATTHRKMTLKHEWLRPLVAILDPMLTVSVPAGVTAATGVDALVHAIEGFTCRRTTPVAKAFGLEAMRLIVPALPHAVRNPADLRARTDMLVGSLLAGLCFGSTDVAAVHCLAEALGGLYDTPHGLANAVFLPAVLHFNAVGYEPEHARVARATGFADDRQTAKPANAC